MKGDRNDFPVGTVVAWASQAGGHRTEKCGVVVYVGKPKFFGRYRRPDEWPLDLLLAPFYSLKFDCGYGVIVRVDRVGKTGTRLDSWYYAPRLSALEAVESPDGR